MYILVSASTVIAELYKINIFRFLCVPVLKCMNISKPDQVVFSVVAVREEDPSQEEEESADKRTGVSN